MRNEKKINLKKVVKSSAAVLGFALYASVAGMLLFGANGFAYIDPSVMTYVIQAVSGAVIAIGAAVGIYWRRAKKKLNDKFEIDENKNKEVESDDIEVYKK